MLVPGVLLIIDVALGTAIVTVIAIATELAKAMAIYCLGLCQ